MPLLNYTTQIDAFKTISEISKSLVNVGASAVMHEYDDKHFVQILPVNDSREHWLGDECWCLPSVEGDPDRFEISIFNRSLIVHNSQDGREQYE